MDVHAECSIVNLQSLVELRVILSWEVPILKKAFNFLLNLLVPDNEADKIFFSNSNLNIDISRALLIHVDNEVIVIKSLLETFL